jgi:hypothetical protein
MRDELGELHDADRRRRLSRALASIATSAASRASGAARRKPDSFKRARRERRSIPDDLHRGGTVKTFLLWFFLIALVLGAALGFVCTAPGISFPGAAGALTEEEGELSRDLKFSVQHLAADIGARGGQKTGALQEARESIERELRSAGLSPVETSFDGGGSQLYNLQADLVGKNASEVVILGAHYDTMPYSPGADDNASGCAALIAIARSLRRESFERTVRFVFFAGSEGPIAGTENMGSRAVARAAKAKNEHVVVMLSLDNLGFYSDADGSQTRPLPLTPCYPSHGDFVAFVGNFSSRGILHKCVSDFRRFAQIPSACACLPGWIPGLSNGDQASFWREGIPAVLVTDTGALRNANYQLQTDTADRLDYTRLTRAVEALAHLTRDLASRSPDLN